MKISIENIEKEYPSNLINYDLLKEKGLGEKDPNEKYFELLNKYKSFFEDYLKEKLPLLQIDNNMKESELAFKPIEETNMDFYQITSSMGLKYVYLRNNLYIEKLNSADIEFLDSKEEYNDETREFISRTFKDVINPYDDSKVIFYGPENGQFLCNSNDVVLGIRYDEFNTELEDKAFQENFIEKQRIISQLITVLSVYGLQQLGVNVKLIQYNEVSIMKKYGDEYAK